MVHTQGSVYINLVNCWEEVGGKESRLSGVQDVEVSGPHAELNVYFSLTWVWIGLGDCSPSCDWQHLASAEIGL